MAEKSKKILIFATSYLPLIGGAELALKHITDRLTDFSFDLITSWQDHTLLPREQIGAISVYRVGRRVAFVNFILPKAFFPLAAFFKGRKLLRANHYDAIFVLQASQAGGAVWLLKTLGYIHQPIIVNIQEGRNLREQSFFIRVSRRFILGCADHITVISQYLKQFLVKHHVPEAHISLIPNGVDEKFFVTEPDQALTEQYKPNDEVVIMTVSRLVEKNAVGDLILAYAIFKKSFTTPSRLIIIGKGPLENSLHQTAAEKNISNEVIFVGQVPHDRLPAYLSIADLFVRPSRSEGLGTAFLEAMAASVPIVGTEAGGITDFLTHEQTGLVCRAGDPDDLNRQMQRLLSDQSLRQKVIQTARALVKEKYSWQTIARQYQTVFQRLIA